MKTTTFIKSIIATLLIASSTFTVKADEGMWLIHLMAQTNYEAMKAKGVELSAEEIYSETVPSLKDAIVALDFGSCTGSMISKNGLMITNHHCAYDDIQKLSSLEKWFLVKESRRRNPYSGQNGHVSGPGDRRHGRIPGSTEKFRERRRNGPLHFQKGQLRDREEIREERIRDLVCGHVARQQILFILL